MRFRLAAIALTAAVCGLIAPVRAADPAAATSDLSGYLPAGTGYYVHINVRQFLAAPVIRKAIPMAADKFDKQLMAGLQMAMMVVPNAKDVPEDQIKQGLAMLKDPKVIAQAFDNAKDFLTDVYVAGVPGDDDKAIVVIKCHEIVAPDLVKTFAPQLQGNPQIPVQIKMHEKGKATVYEFSAPQQPQPLFFTLPKAGVICISGSQDLVEKAATGASGGGLKADLQKLVAEEKKTDFAFFATTGKASDDSGVVSGWGRLVLNADINGEVSATFTNAEKAAAHAKEMNEHLGELVDKVKEILGPNGKDVAGALEKAKPATMGSTVSSKFSITGSLVEKLLTKDGK
jgi:hypothetical protein